MDRPALNGDDSYGAAVESIANKEWERTAKPRRGGPGGGSPRGRRGKCRWLSGPLFFAGEGLFFQGGVRGGFPPRGIGARGAFS